MRQKLINDDELVELLKQGKNQKEAASYFGVSEAAISKRVKRILPPPDLDKYGLSEKQKAFVTEKARGASNTGAAMKAYNCKDRASAKTLANTLMKDPDVKASISELMDFHGMGRSYRVGKLKNHLDNRDPNISLKALDMSFKLDGSFIERRMNLNVNTHSFIDVPVNIDEYRGWDKKSVEWIQKIKQWMDEGLDLSDVEIAHRLSSNADCVRDLKRELARRLKEGIPLDATGWGYELKATNNY